MFFSIIVPVYNVENYLSECLDSILCQKNVDFELILVDDGSTDNSGYLCDIYADKNHNVKCFHKVNGGLSSARNMGLKKASGKYVIFIDSDDWIEPGTLCVIKNAILKEMPDIIVTRLIENYEGHKIYKDLNFEDYFQEKNFSYDNAIMWQFSISENPWPAVKNIYSLDFIKSIKIEFIEGILHEDVDWTATIFSIAKNIKECNVYWYNHRMNREGSITENIGVKNILDLMDTANRYYCNYYLPGSRNIRIIFNAMMCSVYYRIGQASRNKDDDIILIEERMQRYKQMLRITPKLQYKIFFYCTNAIGLRKTYRVLNLFKGRIKGRNKYE